MFNTCENKNHWEDLLILGACTQCSQKISGPRAGEDPDDDNEPDEIDEEEVEHEPLTEEEVDGIYEQEQSQTDHEAYILAHD